MTMIIVITYLFR